jgi:FMN-dependent NADH-azoreductase
MSKLLLIHSSPRGERSHSRTLADHFIKKWSANHPDDEIITRDLGHEPVPFITEAWVVGAFAPAEYQNDASKAAIAVSDALVDEFLSADRYVFSVPMYNLSIPGVFKAYIDQIIRAGRTFVVGEQGYKGIVEGKKLLFVTASGGSFRLGTPTGGYNFQEPYLRAIFGFIGVTDVQFAVADNQNMGEQNAEAAKAEATAKLDALSTTW